MECVLSICVSAVSLAPHIDQKNGERGGMGGDFLQQAGDAAEDEDRKRKRKMGSEISCGWGSTAIRM